MKVIKKDMESTLIGAVIILFLLFTTIVIKYSPNIFCSLICWIGECEDNYGKSCND